VAAGLESFADCVHRYDKGNIDVLPVGTIPPNPQELLSSDKFRDLLEEVSGLYDRVIIDTAPAHLVSDPKLVARWSSALIYVIKAETTATHVARQEIRELMKVNTPILGAVLNGMSEARLRGTYRYGYRRKRYGYGRRGYGYGGYGYTNYGGYGYGGYGGYGGSDQKQK
jgi:Mrp family chromosome partitioning ATPase